MKSTIRRLTNGEDLSFAEARETMDTMFEEATEAQIGALLSALQAKGETGTEIAGFAQGMYEAARTVESDREPLVDTCGTGGDDYDTINVSTTSAIVAAGAGVPVAKHGSQAVSSSSGSADVLEELGVAVDAEPAAVERSIEEHGIGFMLGPVFNPAMGTIIRPLSELGIQTIFKVVGPLTNPAGADAQIVGVYDPDLVPVVGEALSRLDVERALVVHGAGLDEFALHDATTVAEVDGSSVETYDLSPTEVGLERAPVEEVLGGSPEENAADLRRIVEGEATGAKRDIILLNAGATIYVAGEATTIADGVEAARNSIEEGRAIEKLDALRQLDRAR